VFRSSTSRRFFEPFYRVPRLGDPEAPGFGIGLAIATRAIRLHRRTIPARNLVKGGFEIAIHLPVSGGNPLQFG